MADLYVTSHIKVSNYNKEIRFKNLIECLEEYSKTKSDQEAFIFVSTDGGRESVTWSTLHEKSCAAASVLIHLGVKRKEIVAINIRSCPAWLYATFGAMIAGAIPVSISFTYTDGSDLVALLEKLQCCSLLIMDPGLDHVNWNIVQKLLDEQGANGEVKSTKLPYLRYLIGVGFEDCSTTVKDFHDLLNGTNFVSKFPDIDSEDVVTMLQTSGSTGVPKLVVHTHASILSLIGSDAVGMESNYKIFNDRPFNWLGGFPLSVLTGQTRVTVSEFCEPPKNRVSFMKEIIEKEKCSVTGALPPLMAEFLRIQDKLPPDWPLVGILTGGQPITKSLAECVGKTAKFLGCIYGSSESMFLTQAVVRDRNSFTEYACGTPLKIKGIEIKIVDKNGQIVPVDTRGEIFARSPGMFKEYFNDPEKTKAVLTDDGWYKTDDIGHMNEKGEFFVEGRKSNMIISGGMNVAPEILEQMFRSFPGVQSAIIVPVPDDVYYQVLCACVVKTPGIETNEEQLKTYCKNFHADKPGLFTVVPKFYMFLEKLPETKTGKVDRKMIEKLACEKFSV